MKGLELSRHYFEEIGKPAMMSAFPELYPRLAFGLVGEGSECFGFDDEQSQDHDWGPAFGIWMNETDYQDYGKTVQGLYNSLTGSCAGYPPRNNTPYGKERIGALCIPEWFTRYTGHPFGPNQPKEWMGIPSCFLAVVTNGEVFEDGLGLFSGIRSRMMAYYPEDVRIRKIADAAMIMAQAGQYNYPRSLARREGVAAQLALGAFMEAGLSMVYLLNRRYAPFYKWKHRGIKDSLILPRAYDLFGRITDSCDDERVALIEGVCRLVIAELHRQGLTEGDDTFLESHCPEILKRMQEKI